MKDYFYTHEAKGNKIYVFWNSCWLNQLIEINGLYYWVSINECGANWDVDGDPQRTIQRAIESVMKDELDVYQLDTLKELAEFIESEEN